VFERQQRRLIDNQVRQLSHEPDVWEQIRRGCEIYLEDTLDPAIRRISILDAPTALGWDRMREIEGRYLLALLDASLQRAAHLGRVHPGDHQIRLHLLFGALCETAIFVAHSKSPRSALANARAELARLLAGFETPPGRATRKAPGPAGRARRAAGPQGARQ
jgi:hypothetical protein